jgi:hypothetical protein
VARATVATVWKTSGQIGEQHRRILAAVSTEELVTFRAILEQVDISASLAKTAGSAPQRL